MHSLMTVMWTSCSERPGPAQSHDCYVQGLLTFLLAACCASNSARSASGFTSCPAALMDFTEQNGTKMNVAGGRDFLDKCMAGVTLFLQLFSRLLFNTKSVINKKYNVLGICCFNMKEKYGTFVWVCVSFFQDETHILHTKYKLKYHALAFSTTSWKLTAQLQR